MNYNREQILRLQGSKGQLVASLLQPSDARTIVIMMHGLLSNRQFHLFKRLTSMLAEQGIASLRFDFNGHGDSEGQLHEMTVENELLDAKAVLKEVKHWQWVEHIVLLGHSLGGVVAGMLAASNEKDVDTLVQIAAAAVMHDDALAGKLMNARYDPAHIPEYVRILFVKKIGRAYLEAARDIDIFARSCSFSGKVCLVHGTKDAIVPSFYSELYHNQYAHSELHLIDGENHLLLRHPSLIAQKILHFITEHNTK